MSTTSVAPGVAPGVAPAQGISRLLKPASVAVVGASEDQTKFGGRLLRMLLRHRFEGTVFPVNPKRDTLFGLKTYVDLHALPDVPDMVVLTVPKFAIKEHIEVAAAMGAACALIITAGFSDADEDGRRLEADIVRIARARNMRLIGPNCLGVISAANKLVLCSSPVLEIETLPQMAIGLISQSGALMTTFFDRAWAHGIGFSHGISVGNQADLDLADFVEFLVDDPATQVICTYIEGVKDAARFLDVARKARAAGKPWLAVKAGRTQAGSKAAFSHTASIAGDHAVFAAVCRDEGIVLMDDMGAMITLAAMMVRYPDQAVDQLAIVTPSGGGGALASDLLLEHHVPLAHFSERTRNELGAHYPRGQADNPIDFGGRITPDAKITADATIAALLDDQQTSGLFVPVTMAPFPWLRELAVASSPKATTRKPKPVLFTLEAGHTSDPLRAVLIEEGIVFTNSLHEAVKVWATWRARTAQVVDTLAPEPRKASGLLEQLAPGIYDEERSKALFEQYGIDVNAGGLAETAEDAARLADQIGYPVVMKIVSPDITHKSDVGGVAVGVADSASVHETWRQLLTSCTGHVPSARITGVSIQAMVTGELELIVGARRDPQFGPVVVFGAGGVLVELLPQRAIVRAPASAAHVRSLLESLPVWPMLAGYRGRALALDRVIETIVDVSRLAGDLGNRDFELDINPLIVGRSACTAVDGRLLIS